MSKSINFTGQPILQTEGGQFLTHPLSNNFILYLLIVTLVISSPLGYEESPRSSVVIKISTT